MKIKITVLLSFFLIFFLNIMGQEIRLPLEIESGHLYSEWLLNDSIQMKVMLETGFPKVVISESFAKQHLNGHVKLEKSSDKTAIRLWGTTNKTKVLYLVKDTLHLNGRKIFIDALVVDASSMKSWGNRDVVFPIKDLPGITEINIKGKYLIVDAEQNKFLENYNVFDVGYDKKIKGLFLKSVLTAFDSLDKEEKLAGNFLLDLGAPNALFINRDLEKVEDFVIRADRMLLKDTTRFKPNPHTKLGIIMPKKFQIGNISCKGEFIVAMKMFGGNSEKYSGMIGNRLFSHLIIAFDFDNNKVYLKQNSKKVEIMKNSNR